MNQLVSDIKDLKTNHRGEQVQSEALLAKSGKEIEIRNEQIKELQIIIKNIKVPSKNIPSQMISVSLNNKVKEKLLEFNCDECKTTFKSKNELDNHVQRDHTKGANNLFQKLKNKIMPNKPNEKFKCGKCGFNADRVSNFMKYICSKKMTTIIR